MATIDSVETIKAIIAGDGYYEDDARVIKIVKYMNAWGGESYGVMWVGDDLNKYHASPFINNPETIWEAKDERLQNT
jgi:hypothetical protein